MLCIHDDGLTRERASRECQRGIHHCTTFEHDCEPPEAGTGQPPTS
jgi:hypothetical protein